MSRPTKIAEVQALLQRPKGASLDDLCKVTGWQKHSARAALSGLRKTGHALERTPGDGRTGTSIYRILPAKAGS